MAAVERSYGVTARGTRPRTAAGKGSGGKRGLWLPETWTLYGQVRDWEAGGDALSRRRGEGSTVV